MTVSYRTPLIALTASAFAFAGAPVAFAEEPAAEEKAELTKGEKRLAKLLEGRVAGEPKSCIHLRPSDRVQVIDGTALVYGRGKTIYVNETRHPRDIDDFDVLVTRRYSSRLCRMDIVTKVDRFNHMYSGNVWLTDFVPYTRVEKAKSDS